jgi:chromosome partitioning protein
LKIISFSTLKGGVGKSSSLFNIAGLLAEEGKKILVIDADPQGNSTNNFGIDRTGENFKSIKDILEDDIEFESVVIKSPVKELPALDVIPSSIFLTATELKLVSLAGRENILINYIEDNLKHFNLYDYILIDTNPSMSIINQNAFVAATDIILVSDISMNSVEGSELFLALWKDIRKRLKIEDNIKGFLINMYDKRMNLSAQFRDYCKRNDEVKDILFDTVIPMNVKLKEAELEAKPINIYCKSSAGYKSYVDLVNEMKERGIL